MLAPTAELKITIPSHQIHLRANIQRIPLTVLSLDILEQPTIPVFWKQRAFTQLWWKMLARLVGHARLGYTAVPATPIMQCAFPTAPFRLDQRAAHTLNWSVTIDARYNRLLGGITIVWLDDASIPCPTVLCEPIEPSRSSIELPTAEIKGYLTAFSSTPISIVCRWVFIPNAMLDEIVGNATQGVISVHTLDMRVIFLVRYDRPREEIVSTEIIEPPHLMTNHLPSFEQVWWEVRSFMAGFPQKSENNEQQPQPLDPPLTIAQDVVHTCDFRRELFLDGPGWLLSGAPALHSLVFDLLDLRERPFGKLSILLDGQSLVEGKDYSITTIDAYANLQSDEPAEICLRMITVPSKVFLR